MPHEKNSSTPIPAHIAAFGTSLFQPRTLFNPEPAGSGAGGENEGRMTAAEWAEVEKARVAKLSYEKVVDELVKVKGENYDLRRKVAPEGGRILSKSEAEGYDKYLKLGKPDEVAAAVQERDTLKTKDAVRERTDSIAKAAKAAGFKPSVLEKLTPEGAVYEVRKTTVDGKEVETAYIKDAEGKEHALTDFAKTNFDQDFMPALIDTADGNKEQQGPKWTPSGKPAAAGPKNGVNPITAALNPNGAEAPKEVSLFSKD